MARTIRTEDYHQMADTVKNELGKTVRVKYKLVNDGEKHHKVSVFMPYVEGKAVKKQKSDAIKAVRKTFPYRFELEELTTVENDHNKNRLYEWKCYL